MFKHKAELIQISVFQIFDTGINLEITVDQCFLKHLAEINNFLKDNMKLCRASIPLMQFVLV